MNRDKVINQAKDYIKYWGNPNQFTKWYCKDNKTHAWCGMFVDYVFKKDLKCNWLNTCTNFAYVPTIVSWAKKKNYWNTNYTKAKKGDLVIYNWQPSKKNHYSHVGIVYQVKGDKLISIEGNTTNALGRKNCVAKKTRNKKYIAGVILLPYKDEKPVVVKYNLTRYLKKGCKGKDVKELQKKLGGLKVDGDFGTNTEKKLKAYQKTHKYNGKKLNVDGIVGENTAHSLGWLWKGK